MTVPPASEGVGAARLRRLARLALIVALPLGLFLAVGPRFWGEGVYLGGLPIDHVVGFVLLALVAALGFGRRLSLPLIGLLLLLLGAAIEAVQLGLPHRSGSLRDLALDLAGIVIGLILYRRLVLPRLQRGSDPPSPPPSS